MYSADDAEALITRIKDIARAAWDRTAPKPTPTASRRAATERKPQVSYKLPYALFVKALLDFQLAGHQHFLRPFVRLFREVDTAGRGVLDEAQFTLLLQRLDARKSEEQVEAVLAAIDPHGRGQMTFSDCVATLSNDLVALLPSE